MTANPTLVEALRGSAVESAHRGAWAVVDADGDLVASAGDIDRPIFPRSAVKLLQALPLVESGAAERYGLNAEQLAIACASHNGEPRHVAVAASMLAAAGVDAAALECGAHWPYRDVVQREMAAAGRLPGALHNNCSGKHAGFVCLGCLLAGEQDKRAFLSGYVKPEHPVMREVGDAIEATTGWRLADTARGTDGCSIPTYAVPLRQLALGFARTATGIGLREGRARAARRLMAAVAEHPFMVGGSGRFDTRVMERLGERVFCKVGAEGVYCAAFPKAGLGVAVKMDDGGTRACEVVMAALIQRFVRLDAAEHGFVQAFADQPLVNWNGIEVGRLRWAA
ncbi:asparaginase [Rubrivivax gelatinosus]|nr:asparaginase [Rubrivivax gelatinosus]